MCRANTRVMMWLPLALICFRTCSLPKTQVYEWNMIGVFMQIVQKWPSFCRSCIWSKLSFTNTVDWLAVANALGYRFLVSGKTGHNDSGPRILRVDGCLTNTTSAKIGFREINIATPHMFLYRYHKEFIKMRYFGHACFFTLGFQTLFANCDFFRFKLAETLGAFEK